MQAKEFPADRSKNARILSIVHQESLLSPPGVEQGLAPKETFPHQSAGQGLAPFQHTLPVIKGPILQFLGINAF